MTGRADPPNRIETMADEEKDQEPQAEEAAAPEQTPAVVAEEVAAPAAEVETPEATAAPEKPSDESEKPAATTGKPAATTEKPADDSEKAAGGGEASGETPKEGKKDERRDVFAEIDPEGEEKPKILKAKGSKNVHTGIVHVLATFNNTIVTITDRNGNVIGWASSGKMGFKGSRKSTAYAAQLVAQDACKQAMGHGLKEAEVRVKGPGSGRESAVRAVQAIGIDISAIRDVTPVPHNGCRPPKARRV